MFSSLFKRTPKESVDTPELPEYKIKMNGYGEFFVYGRWCEDKYMRLRGTYRSFEDAHNAILARLENIEKSKCVLVAEIFTGD
jgi:hypothetical protein